MLPVQKKLNNFGQGITLKLNDRQQDSTGRESVLSAFLKRKNRRKRKHNFAGAFLP